MIMKRRLNIKKIVSWMLVSAVIMGCVDMFGLGKDFGMVYAEEETKTYFLEGYGAGQAFDAVSWDITTGYGANTIEMYKTDEYKAGIVFNNHSDAGEPVIRLINGASLLNMGKDARSGTAVMKQTVQLDSSSRFSIKFTISMPDACRYNSYEPGGDGITFLITSSDDVIGNTGGGIGYSGIGNSIGIEFDSYYNDGGNGCEDPVAADWDNVTDSGKSRDHVAVVINGKNSTIADHLGTSFLCRNGYDEGFTENGDLGIPKEPEDNRLFTAWVEYDGQNLYVRYVMGDFASAVRPSDPQIVIDGAVNPAVKNQLDAFVERDAEGNKLNYANVKIGFTSAMDRSQANHTVHSVAFVNKYLPDGIKVPYYEKYYVESPDATSDYIEVNGKKYVLHTTNVVADATKDTSVTITDLKDSDAYKNGYTPVDASTLPAQYQSTATVAADGSTVVCQFFDRIPHTDSWQYTANGNEITGECTSDVGICDKDTTDLKIVLTAPDIVYNGEVYDKASYTDNLTTVTGGKVGQIYYEGVGPTVYEYTVVPPTYAGLYRAIIEIDGVRAVQEFAINYAPSTETPDVSLEKDESPKTGENNNFDWLMLMLGSGLLLLVTGKALGKKED